MADQIVVDQLNRLLALHSSSLPRYLASAQPWYPQPDSEAEHVLRLLAEDQQGMADRIGTVILDLSGLVQRGEFPMEFTDLHDLSIDYLLPLVMQRQADELESIREIVRRLQNHPVARAVSEEALGAAQAHLDNLRDLGIHPSAGAGV